LGSHFGGSPLGWQKSEKAIVSSSKTTRHQNLNAIRRTPGRTGLPMLFHAFLHPSADFKRVAELSDFDIFLQPPRPAIFDFSAL
jgi:hypothetical protein